MGDGTFCHADLCIHLTLVPNSPTSPGASAAEPHHLHGSIEAALLSPPKSLLIHSADVRDHAGGAAARRVFECEENHKDRCWDKWNRNTFT